MSIFNYFFYPHLIFFLKFHFHKIYKLSFLYIICRKIILNFTIFIMKLFKNLNKLDKFLLF